jgi:hypothetical protein
VFVSLPKNVLPFKAAEAQSAVVVMVFAGRLSPLRPGDAELRTQEIADGEGATRAYVANEAVFHHLRFRRDKEYIDRLRAWSMEVVPVNDVAGTPSQLLERRAGLGWRKHGMHKGGLHGAGNRRTQIDFDSSSV